MKYIAIPCLILALAGCDLIELNSPQQQACKEIAVSRLKHPGSYDFLSVKEKKIESNQTEVDLSFNAWNDFKVPMLHKISCQFQNDGTLELLSIQWNGRLIRQHELDEIREKL